MNVNTNFHKRNVSKVRLLAISPKYLLHFGYRNKTGVLIQTGTLMVIIEHFYTNQYT